MTNKIVLSISVTPEQKELLKRIAKMEDTKVSTWLATIVDGAIKKYFDKFEKSKEG